MRLTGFRIFAAIFLLLGLSGFILASIALPNFPIASSERRAIARDVDDRQFNFVEWEVRALAAKLTTAIAGGAGYLSAEQQKALVLDYLDQLQRAKQLERELERSFAVEVDPLGATAEQRTELAQQRAELHRLQPLAEQILQQQVSAILKDEGLQLFGGVWPPLQARMTSLPLMLIISPRDEIHQLYAFPLKHGLPIEERELLEERIVAHYDLSALVVPIGGLGLYPAMVVESSNLPYLTNTFAHEWAHHWLTLHPVGLSYARSPALRVINETTASIVGNEIGRETLRRYYPEQLPDEPPPREEQRPETPAEAEERFDLRVTLRDTRQEVDRLLAEGRILEAERYMERRRQLIVENGFAIRKLNQAYFAFHGAYADTPGAGGSDPVGPTVVAIRDQSNSLKAFLENIASVTSFEQLQSVLAQLQQVEEMR